MTSLRTITILAVISFLAIPSLGISSGARQGPALIAKGSVLTLELLSPINSNTNKKGDQFNCRVIEPYQFANAIVTGRIQYIKASGKAKEASKIALSFQSITIGERTNAFNAEVKQILDPINAKNQGKADEEGVVEGKSPGKRVLKRSLFWALIGGVAGGIVAGPNGAAAGATIGAGVGAISALAMDSPTLDFKAGTRFTVKAQEPLRQ